MLPPVSVSVPRTLSWKVERAHCSDVILSPLLFTISDRNRPYPSSAEVLKYNCLYLRGVHLDPVVWCFDWSQTGRTGRVGAAPRGEVGVGWAPAIVYIV